MWFGTTTDSVTAQKSLMGQLRNHELAHFFIPKNQGFTISTTFNTIPLMKEELIKQLAAIADPNRLRIIEEISKKKVITCAEAEALTELSQPTISHHIKLLIDSGLIVATKNGRFTDLSLDKKKFASVSSLISKISS